MSMSVIQKTLRYHTFALVGLFFMFFVQDTCMRSGVEYIVKEHDISRERVEEDAIKGIDKKYEKELIDLRILGYELRGIDY